MDAIIEKARECYSIHGVYPISFSFPYSINLMENQEIDKPQVVGTVIPDKKETYIFNTEKEYYEDYKKSKFGITQKKAGWDCMRHLEIMYNFCLPVFLGIEACPSFNMIHYPKQFLSSVVFLLPILEKNEELYIYFLKNAIDYFNEVLTCEKMMDYVLRISCLNLSSNPYVLFIDSKLPSQPDYLSLCTLIGLKQKYATNCEVLFPVSYIYKDTTIDTTTLYGKGFSYTKVLNPDSFKTIHEYMETKESTEQIYENIKRRKYNFIVFGSVGRCLRLLPFIEKIYNPNEILGFYGEDIPDPMGDPRACMIKDALKKRMTLFVREFARE